MSARNITVLLLALSTLSFLVACGGSSSPTAVAPPSGGFSNSNLNGTYVFSTTGIDANDAPITMLGILTANGAGAITGGSVDIVSFDSAVGVVANQAITNASYTVGADGRGQAKFNATVASGGVTFTLDFALSSSSHGLITEYDSTGTGSGTIDLQPSAVGQSALSGLSYAIGLSGSGLSAPFATAGAITLGATGGVTGTADFVNGFAASVDQAITGSVAVGTGNTPGTAQLVTPLGTYAYDVFAIDTTHLKFIQTDGSLVLSGDAYTLGTSIPSGTLVFTMSGLDQLGDPLGVAGLMPTAASGAVTGGGEDFNDAGAVDTTPVAFTGAFTALAGGRSQLSLNGFENGATNDVVGNYTFAAYPFSSNGVSGVQLLEIDSAGITSGAAYLQSSTTLNASAGYALNLSATNVTGGSGQFFEEDDIAEFTTSSSSFSGIIDINDQTQTSFDQSFSGSYTAPTAAGVGSATTTEHGNAFINYNFYVVNSSTFLILETDAGQIGTGIFETQSASGSPGAIPGISMVRTAPHAHAARPKK